MIYRIIKKYNLTPNKLFLIDGIGAIISFLLLSVLLPQTKHLIGLSFDTLQFLSIVPAMLFIYAITHYFLNLKKVRFWIRILSILNLSYCLLSITTILKHADTLTIMGWCYFIGEICIISFLATTEWIAAKTYDSKSNIH